MYYENPDGVSVHTGFPNPAADSSLQGIDLNNLLIWHSASTFLMQIRGNQWQEIGIFDQDIAIIDRALKPRPIDPVVWQHEGEFAISNYSSLKEGYRVFGTVTSIIHRYRSKP
jgi:SOS-response transcriptional repressor LexA